MLLLLWGHDFLFFTFFEKLQKIMDFRSILASFLEHFGINFRHFFGIDFWMPFWMAFLRFLVENGRQKARAHERWCSLFAPFWRPFSDIDFWMHFGRPLAPFWHPLGSIWLPFGTLWAPFWSLWAPFWLHFRSLGAILVKNHVFGAPDLASHPQIAVSTPEESRFPLAP